MRYLVVLIALALAGCVTPKVIEAPAEKIDFTTYKTITYRVHDSPETEYGASEAAKKYGRDIIGLTDALLGQKLKSMGYTVQNEGPADLTLDVNVKAAKPGSAAARFFIGFGAGRAVFLYDATFTDQSGKSLGRFEGGRSHTGMEFGQEFANLEQIQTFAATRAVAQIEEFLKNGGTFPSQQTARR